MTLRFPYVSTQVLPTNPAELVNKLTELKATESGKQGYVRVQTPGADAFLFFHMGKAFAAGRAEDDRLEPCTIPEFFEAAAEATSAAFFQTDLALFLCITVLFRKQPIATIPSDIIDSESLIKHIRSTGRDAVLVIRRGDARSLVFCRGGEPAALYPAHAEEFPEESSLTERIVKYVFQDMTYRGTSLDLYDEIKLPPAEGAGKQLNVYLEEAKAQGTPEVAVEQAPVTEPTVPNLFVWLGDRVITRVPVLTEIKIGREEDNDVVLNNLSVSRHHAKAVSQAGKVVFQDLGSANGVVFRGKKVDRAVLEPGDEIVIGKYKFVYARHVSGTDGAVPASAAPKSSGVAAVEKTMALMGGQAVPVVEYNGKPHKVKGLVFTIGKDSNAHIRIGGWFVAPVHVRIFREPEGTYRVEHVAGRRQLKVNGRAVKKSALSNGDELLIGPHQFRFTVPEEGGAPKTPRDITVLGPNR